MMPPHLTLRTVAAALSAHYGVTYPSASAPPGAS